MVNEMSIDVKTFERMPQKEQMTVLYQNTEELKIIVSSYKFQQKIQYAWLSFLTVALIGKMFLGVI